MKNFKSITAVAGVMMATAAVAEEAADVAVDDSVAKWENSVDFALSVAKGNTENMLLRAGIQTKKKDDVDAYFGSFSYNYGEENNNANEDEFLAKATWKHNFKGKSFYGLRFDGRSDKFADIDYRLSFNATYGYYWIDTETTVFSTEFGLGVTTEDKGIGNEVYLNGLFDQHYEHKFNENVKFYQDLSFAPRLDDVSDYRIEFEAGLETKITETIAFRVSFEDRYESTPAAGKENNDMKFLTGLSYKF